MPIKFRGKVVFDPAGIQIGDSGPRLREVLAGSLAVTAPSIASSATGTVAATVAGLATSGTSYKLLVTPYVNTGCHVLLSAAASSNSPTGVVTLTFANFSGADCASQAASLAYFAAYDK
jgi:hypothetical protein